MIGMAFHVDTALHIKGLEDILQTLLNATRKHCCRSSTTNIKGSNRPITNHLRIEVNLSFNSVCVSLCYIRIINLFVIRAVRTYLLTKRDVKLKPEFINVLEFYPQILK